MPTDTDDGLTDEDIATLREHYLEMQKRATPAGEGRPDV